ncbi:endonuclease IV [Campylobacter sputorum subsp. bubulus]|uniref:Probable endonuclease 4 n=1 Tax=Campylobacter sputorum subsp. sputorum TaxID=32024 RepID=A0A381DIA2_9BACT|nr:deoxyribonuclease IV [Campylobacter sputorum]ASM35393.1 endonuclease IV [Campylobacter sputorum aubsp. sputorum RM3237]ASM37092.1 endonuclease IV [Campylobacter sputorum bv. faecalis CCUG 20703]KAB0582863.1 deoxyribonuclease IV [Campylobacter sputorum subsp. sputorum]QEL05585.1 endonuclease IV [Campylobacter sputorum subsp. sputorum]SUX08588.1 endonuclease IV [Campylobacter sputorum subsp. bubulus]
MKFIGAHVSIAGGVENAPINAMNIGANAFGMFVKNQRQWSAKPLDNKNISEFKNNLQKAEISPEHVLVHNSYLINLGSNDPLKRQKSIDSFLDEINRVNLLGLKLINFHPGSHLNEISADECLENISNSINYLLQNTQNVTLVIENTAGQGSNLGFDFSHLAYLVQNCIDKERIGICIDTCHLFSAGYDIRSKSEYKKTFDEFDKVIGKKFLKGMHINDSKTKLGSKKDRHESIGKGTIGLDGFSNLMQDDMSDNIPLILETIDDTIWDKEINLLRKLGDK